MKCQKDGLTVVSCEKSFNKHVQDARIPCAFIMINKSLNAISLKKEKKNCCYAVIQYLTHRHHNEGLVVLFVEYCIHRLFNWDQY